MNQFEKQGVIQLGFKKIAVLDLEGLRKLATVGYLKE